MTRPVQPVRPNSPPEVTDRLGLLWGPGFALGILCAAPFFYAYKLDRAAHVRILYEIESRQGD